MFTLTNFCPLTCVERVLIPNTHFCCTLDNKGYVYGFWKESLKQIKRYLTNRLQRTKLKTGFSKWTEMPQGVPQGFVLGLFLTESTNVCNYADHTTFYALDSDLHYLISRLEHDSVLAIEWFECNYIKKTRINTICWYRDINMKVCGQRS